LILFSTSLWLTSHMTEEWGFAAFLGPQLLRGFAIMLCIVPSVNMALTGFAMAELRYASGLFNLMRNLGGALGIAIVNTWLQDQTRIHVARMGENLGLVGQRAGEMVASLANRIGQVTPDPAHALLIAQGELARIVSRSSLTLAFNEVFRLMSWIFLFALLMVPFCRPIRTLTPALSLRERPPPPDAH